MLACLALEEVEPGRYRGQNLPIDYRRVFGGQILAQMIAAATAASPDKTVKSVSVLFPREGDTAQAMDYLVTKYQDGRTFGTTSVVAVQGEKTVATASVSMHIDEEGLDRQDDAPGRGAPKDAVAEEVGMIPWEVRVVDGVDLSDRAAGPATYAFWTRTPAVDDRPVTSQALLAHATDLTVLGTALRPIEGLSQADTMQKFHSAVTGHTLWFHQPFRSDEWLLVDQVGPVVARGRAFGQGHVWAEDGRLVASFAQESMLRTAGYPQSRPPMLDSGG
jgi:acyl-CoA thioesterase-2